MPILHRTLRSPWIPLSLLVAAMIVLAAAPPEATLGNGIRFVYLHVSLTWTGMTALILAGIVGLILGVTGRSRVLEWARAIGWVGTGLFAAGLGVSVLAARVNWGGVFWEEPRLRSSLNALAMALIVQISSGWLPWKRLTGALYVTLALFLAWTNLTTALVLHPRNPVATASSSAIRGTFFTLFALGCLCAGWLVWRAVSAGKSPPEQMG